MSTVNGDMIITYTWRILYIAGFHSNFNGWITTRYSVLTVRLWHCSWSIGKSFRPGKKNGNSDLSVWALHIDLHYRGRFSKEKKLPRALLTAIDCQRSRSGYNRSVASCDMASIWIYTGGIWYIYLGNTSENNSTTTREFILFTVWKSTDHADNELWPS